MSDVTVVESPGRGKAFWSGLAIGVLAMLLAVFALWILGVINLGDSTDNEATINNEADNNNDAASTIDENTVNNTDETETLNEVANEVEEETTKQANASPFVIDAVLAKSVDSQANPIDETSTFGEDDDRFYVVITLSDAIPADTEISAEWFFGDTKLSDFSTKVDKGQSVTYFFANNPGDKGEYSVKVLVDGVESDELKFSVE